MIKPRLTTIMAAVALLLLSWGCSSPNKPDPQVPGQQQIDKAKGAKETVEQQGKEQEKQPQEQQ